MFTDPGKDIVKDGHHNGHNGIQKYGFWNVFPISIWVNASTTVLPGANAVANQVNLSRRENELPVFAQKLLV